MSAENNVRHGRNVIVNEYFVPFVAMQEIYASLVSKHEQQHAEGMMTASNLLQP